MVDGFKGKGMALTHEAFDNAAEALGIEAAKLWAVMEIEARSCGFLDDRRPVILFERHKFHEFTDGKFSAQYPDISNKAAGGYGKGGSNQYLRFQQAYQLDRQAALKSTSWGLGQVMGFNATAAGFADASTMVQEMCGSEAAQLAGMVRFIIHRGLDQTLRVANWTSFAAGYNGAKYYINKYDDRLRGAHQKFSTGPMPDLRVREAQLLLTYLGYDPGSIDGWFGPRTARALNDYRDSEGRGEIDELHDEDIQRLREAAYAD